MTASDAQDLPGKNRPGEGSATFGRFTYRTDLGISPDSDDEQITGAMFDS